MKPTKMRNNQIYRASLRTRSNQLGSPLSKDLRKKYGKRSVRVVEGDTIRVVRGEYKDVDGKVARVSTSANSVAIDGIKKEKGQGDKFDVLIHTSNVVVTGLNTGDSWRMAKIEGKHPKSVPRGPKKPQEPAEKTDDAKTITKTDDAKTVEKPDDAKTMKKTNDAKPIEKTNDAKTEEQPDDAKPEEKTVQSGDKKGDES